ncbi:MAG: glycosyl hydrolase [Luteitalea sp.]|nr:glycosyl hydrolase [Luteitalea sp.]
MRRVVSLSSALVVFCAATTLTGRSAVEQAPTYDEALFSALKWRSVGPNRGGRSTAVAGGSRPLEYYFGATGGGLWKTSDGGVTWTPVSDEAFESSSVGAVAVAPSNPDIVYVGMGETQLRGNIIQGDGVYKSIDAGKTWTHVGLEKTMAVARVRVHPTDPDLVYVAALGDPYRATRDRGVYLSKNGGKTWDQMLFRDDTSGAVDLALDPQNPDIVYAALWEVSRTPHSLSSGGPGSGLFKSTDAGANWTELTRNTGLPKDVIGKIGVSVSGSDGNRVYAIVEAEDGGVFKSDDGGETWALMSDDRRLRQRAFYYTRIYADPQTTDTVYVLNTGFYRSTNAGKTYKSIRVPHGDNHDLWIAPDDPKRMIEANDGGANVSFTAGESWTEQDFPTAQFYNAFVTSDVPYHICGAQQDNSTACVLSTAPGRGPGGSGRGVADLYPVGGCESGYIAQSPKSPDVFFAGCYGGTMTRYDRRTRMSRAVNVWPDNPMGHSSAEITERFQWTYPIVFSPFDANVLYAGSQHLWRSTDEGQSWERISSDLTRHDPSTMEPSGGPITLDQTGVETYATIFTIAPSRHEPDVIWIGSDDGLAHVTRDGGKSWQKVTPPDLPDFARISLIEASPHKVGTAYLAANRYQRADRAPYVYKTDDYGQTWTKIVDGLPPDDFPRAIREDIKRPGLLYLGTEHGIYVSFDDGQSWQTLRLNLAVTPVHGVVSTAQDLVIGTHGRSFYVLDDIEMLRQLQPELTTSTFHLFTPGRATRCVDGGVTIDYYLKEDAEEVTVEILDQSGDVIREYTGTASEKEDTEETTTDEGAEKSEGSEENEEEGDDEKEEEEEEEEESPFGPPRVRVGTKAGVNRLAWDMRHEDARDFEGLIMWSGNVRGPLALPGTYRVRVTADDQTADASFEIVTDPRTNVTDADLTAQFELAQQINQRVSDAHEAVLKIRHVKVQIDERTKQANDTTLTAEADALKTKLTDIEGVIYQHRLKSNQDALNYGIRLNNKLAALQGVVESADGRPTAQSEAVFQELSTKLDTQLRELQTLFDRDLMAFNLALKRHELAAIAAVAPAAEETSEKRP